ncbi:hypothetical protein GCM10011611_22970 [Aliidongia dinghuensis]|uniref:DUF721 domain-containing protein n=1 Tax=Aliidongia dinghuensis TaxID=1867774 RepID=A0A8J3E365_9PROT|nr:DciA family protein [Aliidongia dinghuensis]GGF16602.1 hypothetical protein GCM10011611_22970 [Aliidongia dinghuensis]
MKSIAGSVSKIAAPVLGRRGLAEAEMILGWAAVVGEDLARDTLPIKLSFGKGERVDGTLHLKVVSAAAPEVRHREPQIIERINGFFGYRAVAHLKLTQGPLPGAPVAPPKSPRPLTPAESQTLHRSLDGIADPDLKAALERWGRAVLGDQPPPAAPLAPRRKSR